MKDFQMFFSFWKRQISKIIIFSVKPWKLIFFALVNLLENTFKIQRIKIRQKEVNKNLIKFGYEYNLNNFSCKHEDMDMNHFDRTNCT